MSHKEELMHLLTTAIQKIEVQKKQFSQAGFLNDFQDTIEKILFDVRNNSLPVTGTPRGLTRWLGEYIDQMSDKSIWAVVVKIDELLKIHY